MELESEKRVISGDASVRFSSRWEGARISITELLHALR